MYENKVIDGHIAYFKYSESSGQDAIIDGYKLNLETIQKSEITAMLVNITEPKQNWSSKAQQEWLKTGALAEKSGIKKWGVVCGQKEKILTLRYLVKGGGEKRSYKTFVSCDEEDCLKWLREDH